MAIRRSRRGVRAVVGSGVLVASVGMGLACEVGLAPKALADDAAGGGPDSPGELKCGELEPLGETGELIVVQHQSFQSQIPECVLIETGEPVFRKIERQRLQSGPEQHLRKRA